MLGTFGAAGCFSFSPNKTITTGQGGLVVTDDDALNDLDAGATIAAVALPMEGNAYERYLGILCVTATTTTTAGAINAFLTKDVSKWKAYPDGQN